MFLSRSFFSIGRPSMSRGLAMHRRLPATFWISIGVIALCFFLFMLTLDYPGMSGTFPRLVLLMIGAVTIADLIKMLAEKESVTTVPEAPGEDPAGSLKKQGKVLYLAVLMFVFFAFMHLLGVILGTFVFVLFSGWTLGYKKIGKLIMASAIIAVSVYLIFVVIMDCFLPQGYLFGLMGG